MAKPEGPQVPLIPEGVQDPPVPPASPDSHAPQGPQVPQQPVPHMLPLNWSHFNPNVLENQTKMQKHIYSE